MHGKEATPVILLRIPIQIYPEIFIMQKNILNQFRTSISRHHESLLEIMNSDEDKKKYLGQSDLQEIQNAISEFKTLLEKIEHEEYGKCVVCDGQVEVERLEQDCTTNICLDCYSEEQLRQLERDLELAAKVQKQLLPHCVPSISGVQIAVMYESAREVGGDYYDFFCMKNGNQGVVIGDVMGKGLPASMLMSNLQATLRILGPEYKQVEQLAAHINRLFRYNLKLIRFISLFLGALDINRREFTYCSAGHHPALWWQKTAGKRMWLKPTAPAIGLIPDSNFYARTIRINSGDIIVLYTDGLVEARRKDQEYGEQGLLAFVKQNQLLSAEQLVAGIWQDNQNFAGPIQDDKTLVVLKFD